MPAPVSSSLTAVEAEQLSEAVSRSRRIETRLTRYLEVQGIDTKIQRPFFKDGKIIVPSPAVSIENIVQTIPRRWVGNEPVDVVLADTNELICKIIVT